MGRRGLKLQSPSLVLKKKKQTDKQAPLVLKQKNVVLFYDYAM